MLGSKCSLAVCVGLVAAGLGFVPAADAAVNVAYYTDFDATNTGPSASITSNGFTPIQIADITTFNFSTANIVVINESSTTSDSSGLLGRQSALTSYVNAGGVVVIHDRFVNNAIIPGGSGIALTYVTGTDLQVITSGNKVITGPFGTITDTTLDAGNFSDHGYATTASLPAGSTVFLSAGTDATHAAAFSYALGLGRVYYSTIPLDYYLGATNTNTPAAFRTVYAPNVIAYAGSLVPEPASLGLLAVGGVTLLRRRRTA